MCNAICPGVLPVTPKNFSFHFILRVPKGVLLILFPSSSFYSTQTWENISNRKMCPFLNFKSARSSSTLNFLLLWNASPAVCSASCTCTVFEHTSTCWTADQPISKAGGQSTHLGVFRFHHCNESEKFQASCNPSQSLQEN